MDIGEDELERKIIRVVNNRGLFADHLSDYLNYNNNKDSILWKFLNALSSTKEDNSKTKVLKESEKLSGILLLLHSVSPCSIPQHRFADVVPVERETIRLYLKKIEALADFQDTSIIPWIIKIKQKKEKYYALKDDFFNILSPLIPITAEPERNAPTGTSFLVNYHDKIDKSINYVENVRLRYTISNFISEDQKNFLVLTGKRGSGKTRQIVENLTTFLKKYVIWINSDPLQLSNEFFEDLKKVKYKSIVLIDGFGKIKNMESFNGIFSLMTDLHLIKWIIIISEENREKIDLGKYDVNIEEHMNLFEKNCIDSQLLSQKVQETIFLEKELILNWWNVSKGNWNHFLALCKETLDSEKSVEVTEKKIEVLALLMRTSLYKKLEHHDQQGELNTSNGELEWVFPIRISEKRKYRYAKDSGNPVTTLFDNNLQEISIIIGKRGAGKTFATYQLEAHLIEAILDQNNIDYIPFRIELGELGLQSKDQLSYNGISLYSKEIKLTQLLQSSWQSSLKYLNVQEREIGLNLLPWIKKLVKTHKILLILDAWDEIPEQLSDTVEKFLENVFEEVPIIITSRELPKGFSLPDNVKIKHYVIDSPTLTEIKKYFKYRWTHFGYKTNLDHFNALNTLPNEFRRPFNIQALSLLPPSSSFPSNEMVLYRRMIHCSILWDYLKKHSLKQYSKFKTYEDILNYLQKTKHKNFQDLSLIELIQDSKNEKSILHLVGKIAYLAYFKESSILYNEAIRENPLIEYFLEPKIDEKSSIINAVLLEPHLYHYFAAEYVYLQLLNENLIEIPGTEVLDSFKEILSYDERWKISKIGVLCDIPDEVIFEYYAFSKIKGTRPLKAGFGDGTFTESYRWGTGIPGYVRIMTQELLSEYKTIKDENSKKKIIRKLLTELIFDPPQTFFSSGYDVIIKDWDERTGLTEYPSIYRKAIYDLHGLPINSSIIELIRKTSYSFIFPWILADEEGQITPVISQAAWDRLNGLKKNNKELKKIISKFLLAINFKPEVERVLLANLTGEKNHAQVLDDFIGVKTPLNIELADITPDGKEWLLEKSDPRQIDQWWGELASLDENPIHSLRIRLSQGDNNPKNMTQLTSLINEHLKRIQENSENNFERDIEDDPIIKESWIFRRGYESPSGTDEVEFILAPLIQSLVIKDKSEAIVLFLDLYDECTLQGRIYLLELVRRWDLFWLKDTLLELLETAEEPLNYELINILGLWEERRAVEILKELWKSKKFTYKQVLSMIADWIYLKEWPWAEEFILHSSIDCWLKGHSYYGNVIEIGFKYAQMATIKRIRMLLNDYAKTHKDLGTITKFLVPFRYFDEERLELLFEGLNYQIKNALFRDIHYNYTWRFENFILNHLKEVEDPHIFSIFISPSRIKSNDERKLLLKERLKNIKWESLSLENGKLEDSYSYNSLIDNFWELTNQDSKKEDLGVLIQIWDNLDNEKTILTSLTKILIGEGIETVETTIIHKYKDIEDFWEINSILEHIPTSKGREKFFVKLITFFPTLKFLYNELEHNENIREFLNNIQKLEQPIVSDYFLTLWRNVPDELVDEFLECSRSSSLSTKNLHLRFSKLPNAIVWLLIEKWTKKGTYYINKNSKFLKDLIICQKEMILNSHINSNRKILLQKVLKEFHKEEEILSLYEIYQLVKNLPELAEEWERRWEDVFFESKRSDYTIEEIFSYLTKRLQEDDTYLADRILKDLCVNREEELKLVTLNRDQKRIIIEYLKDIYSYREIKPLIPIYKLVKRDIKEKESWEMRWEEKLSSKDQITLPSVEIKDSSPIDEDNNFEEDNDWRLEFAEESSEEGKKLLNKIHQNFNKVREELYSINLDEFFSKMLTLNYADASKIATELTLERITLVREAINGTHGDGTCFWDYKGAFEIFRSILFEAVIEGEKLNYDKNGFLLEQVIIAIAEFKVHYNELNVAKYATNDEISVEKLLQPLSVLPVNQLYPFIILHGFDKWHTDFGFRNEQLKWKRMVYTSLIDILNSPSL